MVRITLKPKNETYFHDSLVIDPKTKYVEFHAFIDGDGNIFRMLKEDLKRLIE